MGLDFFKFTGLMCNGPKGPEELRKNSKKTFILALYILFIALFFLFYPNVQIRIYKIVILASAVVIISVSLGPTFFPKKGILVLIITSSQVGIKGKLCTEAMALLQELRVSC